jgi:hypothetical protein
MPVITSFYGIIIKMYFRQSEHNPPHFHCIYGEYMGAINLKTFEMMEGDLPKRALKMVTEWGKKYQNELLKIWETQEFIKLPPLD